MIRGKKIQGSSFFQKHYLKIRSQTDPSSWILQLQCQECGKCGSKHDFSNQPFLLCISNIIELEQDEEIESIRIDDVPIFLKDGLHGLREFLYLRGAVHDLNLKFEAIPARTCIRSLATCLLLQSEMMYCRRAFDLDHLFLEDPVKYVKTIAQARTNLSGNPDCAKCMNIQEKEIERLITLLTEDGLIKAWISENDPDLHQEVSRPYDLINQSLLEFPRSKIQKNKSLPRGREIERYNIAGSDIIEARISNIDGHNEQLYELIFHLPSSDDFIRIIKSEVEQELENDQLLLKMEKFEDVLNRIVEITGKKVKKSIILENQKNSEIIILMTSFSVLGLGKIFPVLIDENIEEIFLDSPDNSMYLHHVRYQHCRTNVSLTRTDIERIISRLRLETDRNLNELFPSLKCVIKNNYFYARFNVDVKPLNPLGFSLDIRRLNKKVFNIIDLINLGTLNIDVAAFLVFCLHARLNLTIVGKTDTGKTTLLNALDMLYPHHLRKIYVEDEIETLSQDPVHYHQLKFKTTTKERKSDLIKNLLHRSPEVLILGEILTREETEAMFHCLATGMRGLQTIHANNTASLITRLQIHFNISSNCFNDLDFIVLLNKHDDGKRKLMEITEFHNLGHDEGITPKILTAYNPSRSGWSELRIEDSRVMNDFFARTRFDHATFNEYMEAVKKVMNGAIKNDLRETWDLVKEFNQVYMCYRDYF